jgi:hypothetical protein
MIRFELVKELVRLPLYFILFSIITFAVLGSVLFLSAGEVTTASDTSLSVLEFFLLLITQGNEILPVSIILSGIIVLFRLLRYRGRIIFPLSAVFVTAFILLWFGSYGLNYLGQFPESAVQKRDIYTETVFTPVESGMVRFETRQGERISPVIWVQNAPVSELFFFTEGRITSDVIQADDGSGDTVVIFGDQYNRNPELPPLLSVFFKEIRSLNTVFTGSIVLFDLQFLLGCAAISLFIVSCWTFVHITRWPLFNAVIVLVVFRGVFFLFTLVSDTFLREMTRNIVDATMLDFVPLGAIILGSFVFTLVNLVIMPFDQWKREIGYE